MLFIALAAVVSAAGPAERRADFVSSSGQSHRAWLTIPPEGERTGASVLLIGGGAAWDEHWTAPGGYTVDGATTRVTVDGLPTRDGDTIAAALPARGFIVMRWSSIPDDDARGRDNPALAAGLAFPRSVELTREALGALRTHPEVDPRRTVLVGHSLGAARACQVADDGVVAMAFLSGAYLSATSKAPREVAAAVMTELPGIDADRSGGVDPAELGAWRERAGNVALPPMSLADRDADGVLRPWEIAASVWLDRADAGDTSLTPSKSTLGDGAWPFEVIRARAVPVLALYGGLDPMSFHGPWLEREAARRPDLEVAYFAGLGHQMSPEREGLIGPIDARVVEALASWLGAHAGRAR